MSCLNFSQVILAGRVTGDIELKTTQNGLSVTSFSIAVNRRTKNNEGQKADFFTVIAWRKTAEFVSRYFCKGMPMFVIGQLQQRTWEDKNGNKQSRVEILANEVRFIDSKKDLEEQQTNTFSNSASDDGFEELENDDDLPF